MIITVQEHSADHDQSDTSCHNLSVWRMCWQFFASLLPALINEKFNADDSPDCGCNEFLRADWDCPICLGAEMMIEMSN